MDSRLLAKRGPWLVAGVTAALVAADPLALRPLRYVLPLHAAGLVAWLGIRARAAARGVEPDPWRTLAALALAAACARLGWGLLHASALAGRPAALLDVRAGFSVLFVPLGVLAVGARPRRDAGFRRDALASLPLAFATARLGCLATGCCHGVWSAALGARVPTAALEATACAALALGHASPRAAAHPARGAVALLGLALVRLAVEPWRARPPLGTPWPAPACIAAAQATLALLALALCRTSAAGAAPARARELRA